MENANGIDEFTSKLDETLPVIKEVSSQFQNPVRKKKHSYAKRSYCLSSFFNVTTRVYLPYT